MQENQRSKLYLQNLPGFFASFRRHFVQIVRRKPSSPLRKILYRRFWSELAISRKITIFLCSDRSGENCFVTVASVVLTFTKTGRSSSSKFTKFVSVSRKILDRSGGRNVPNFVTAVFTSAKSSSEFTKFLSF